MKKMLWLLREKKKFQKDGGDQAEKMEWKMKASGR